MRIALVLAVALFATSAGCAKKSKPAATPASTETKPADSPAPGGPPDGDAPGEDKEGKGGSQTKGDPCDGGEAK